MIYPLKKRLKKLKRNRRGQIRGIDFALAMLIFIIAFSQIILVLSNLLIPSLVQLETYTQEQELNKLYSNIFLSTGNPGDWGTKPYSELSNFRFGLLSSSNSLDFSKINRLASGISSYWAINYIDAKLAYGLIRDFAIEIYSPISIVIEDISAGLGQISVKGVVQEYQTLLEGVDVWVFSIDSNNNVVYNYTTTQELSGRISFHSTLSVNNTAHYSLVTFASVGEIYQNYQFTRLIREESGLDYNEVAFDFIPVAIENTNSFTSSIDVSCDRSALSDDATVITLFPNNDYDIPFYSQTMIQTVTADGNIYSAEDISIPTKGLAVAVVQENEGLVKRAGVIGIPMFLTPEVGGIFGPIVDLNPKTYLTETRTLVIRDIFIKCRLWYW